MKHTRERASRIFSYLYLENQDLLQELLQDPMIYGTKSQKRCVIKIQDILNEKSAEYRKIENINPSQDELNAMLTDHNLSKMRRIDYYIDNHCFEYLVPNETEKLRIEEKRPRFC